MDNEGNCLQLCDKFKIHCTKEKYNHILNAIPLSFQAMDKQDILYSNITPNLKQLCTDGVPFSDSRCNNTFLRSHLLHYYAPNPVRRKYILKDFKEEDIKKIRIKFMSSPVPPKAKEILFKIINNIYPSKEFLRTKFKINIGNCSFCETDNENLNHLFFDCMIVWRFWFEFQSWIHFKGIQSPAFILKEIQFRIFNKIKISSSECCINNLIILGKYYLHKCRFFRCRPI
ncbi:hypothetical protein XENORESO_020969 [Xenotaenia resolanae]|uniref:Reverse transcriptase zinc-binding domain-containing protein n=1 Tax=Xenotaenia resolanae TaxID=208358 RepID=A0ABV0W682_9TELE